MSRDAVRFETAVISEMRQEYLFLLAHLCHVPPTQSLKLRDFFRLVLDIDQYVKENGNTDGG